jgi:hypothetical protein
VLPVQQTSLLVPSSGLLLCPDPEAIRRPQVAVALEEEHVFDADSAAAGLPLFDVPEAGTASDGSRVMIAPQRGSARMPVSHQEQGCRTRCLSVLQLANTGAAARHAATTRRARAEVDHDDRNVAVALVRSEVAEKTKALAGRCQLSRRSRTVARVGAGF